MPNAGIVNIKLDDSFTQTVCDYAVGFLKDATEPAGTGTFVKLGNVYGILTAGHVLEPFPLNEGVVGLVRFPTIEPALQNYKLNLAHTDRTCLWNGKDGDAPDLAFLKIPELDGRALEAAGAVFYNLGIERKFEPGTPGNRISQAYAIVGVVGEWTEIVDATHGKGKKLVVGGLFGDARITNTFKEGKTELVELEINYETSPRVPKSYGGVSGGALWELHVELGPRDKVVKVNKRLHGVAFRQSGDHRLITCNAAPSIDVLVEKIRAKWPEAK
jgi:hypothetical protein